MSELKIILNKDKKNGVIKSSSLTPARILILGFILVILLGGIILSLPVASEDGMGTSFINALFTSTSAVCVTGLVVVDTANHYSNFGEIIILCLIQVGGLGFMTFATLFSILLGRKINLRERILLQESFNQITLEGMVRLVKNVLLFSFSIEGAGAFVLFLRWYSEMGWQKALYFAVFHSISAFNNAGFDLFGNFSSLTGYANDVTINVTIMALFILGGLGFAVLTEAYFKKGRKLSLHSHLVLKTTGILIAGGAILIFLLEMHNPNTIGNLDFHSKILASLFQSVTPRTAGFNTLSIADLRPATLFLIIFLMFIGASPGSTGGGIKTTTLVCIVQSVVNNLRGRESVVLRERTLTPGTIRKSFSIVFLAIFWLSAVIFILLISEKASFLQILFETVSAFGTVGLSMGITPALTVIGKVAIILTMYFGRVGLLTAALAISLKNNKAIALTQVKYPEEKIIIG